MGATRRRETRKRRPSEPPGSACGVLLISREFEVLGWRGNVQALLPPHPAGAPFRLSRRSGSPVRLLMDAVERGEPLVEVPAEKGTPPLRISIVPCPSEAGRELFAVLLESLPAADAEPAARVHVLEEQLQATKDCLRTTVEEYEAATEELRCAYEELRTANEELESHSIELRESHVAITATRDRLEAVKRSLELQNTGIQHRLDELRGLLNCIGFPVILLGCDLRIRLFNRPAARLFELTSADEGRLLRTLDGAWGQDALTEVCNSVLESLQPAKHTAGSHGFQIRPLITPDNRIAGVILLVLRG